MTCKDCIHYDVCNDFIPTDLDSDVFDYCREGRTDEIPDIEERCSSFKDRNRFIEIPCKAGDTVYIVDGTTDGIVVGTITRLEQNIYTTPSEWITIEGNYQFFGQLESKNRVDLLLGKTVFLTKEEAEAKLKEREG